jgi:hypothetical protein
MANAESPSATLNRRVEDGRDYVSSYTVLSPHSILTTANSDGHEGHEARTTSFLSEDSNSLDSLNQRDRKSGSLKKALKRWITSKDSKQKDRRKTYNFEKESRQGTFVEDALQSAIPSNLDNNHTSREDSSENPKEDVVFSCDHELRKPFPDLLNMTNSKRSMTEPFTDSGRASLEMGQVSSARTWSHMDNNLGPGLEMEAKRVQMFAGVDLEHQKNLNPEMTTEMTSHSPPSATEPTREDRKDLDPQSSSPSVMALYKRKSWPPNAEGALMLAEPLGSHKNTLESGSRQEASGASPLSDGPSQVPNLGSTSTSPEDSDLLMNLDVTGKETGPKSSHHVSSKDRHRYKKAFLELSDEEVIGVTPCALERELFIHGRIYLTPNHLCFHGRIARKYVRVSAVRWITSFSLLNSSLFMCQMVIHMSDIVKFEIIKDSCGQTILISTMTTQIKFRHFENPEEAFGMLERAWTTYHNMHTVPNKYADMEAEEDEALETEDIKIKDPMTQAASARPKSSPNGTVDSIEYPEEEVACRCGITHSTEADVLNQVFPAPVDQLNELLYGDSSLFLDLFFKKRRHSGRPLIFGVIDSILAFP